MEEYHQITIADWLAWKEDIRRRLAETAGNFVGIGYRLRQIRDSEMYRQDGAEDIFDFANKEYGLSKSAVSRFIAINERFSEGGNSLELRSEFRCFGSSKLSEMLTLTDSECELITEKTTIKEIRELKEMKKEDVSEELNAPEQAAELSALDKCIVDFFKGKKDMLNAVLTLVEDGFIKAAVTEINPSGNLTHKKGIIFLSMFDYYNGLKYKQLGISQVMSLTWEAFLDMVKTIFSGVRDKEDPYTEYYGVEMPESRINATCEPVATSQQEEEERQEEKEEVKEPESRINTTCEPDLEEEKTTSKNESILEEKEEKIPMPTEEEEKTAEKTEAKMPESRINATCEPVATSQQTEGKIEEKISLAKRKGYELIDKIKWDYENGDYLIVKHNLEKLKEVLERLIEEEGEEDD